MEDLPIGTVTFVFTDIEGSTRLLQQFGDAFLKVLDEHRSILRGAVEESEGHEVSTEGDSFFLVFPSPVRALEAAVRIQRDLAAHPWPEGATVRVRMGMHTGEGMLGGDNYVGLDVHRAARIAAAGHGGQVLLSDATRALVERSLPVGIQLKDLGQHRLKDLVHPERLYQVAIEGLPSEFPPPKTLDARPNNLPAQLTSFIGRREGIAALVGLVRQNRLVTLTGPGGTGKTRLALEAAAQMLLEFSGGAFFVDLSAITDPALVPSAIAEALGIREDPARPTLDAVIEHLREKELLLVLDNFEQVTEARSTVGAILKEATNVKSLVTSREILRIYGEQEYQVPPLTLPDPRHLEAADQLSQYEAVALFIDRAVAMKPAFAVTNENAPAVAEIATRLDGLPLAIELAASRVKVLSPQAILARLGQRLPLLTTGAADLPERQRTLRGAIEWSHDLLEQPERRLFARLAIFAGGWSLESAEAVCAPSELGIEVLDGMASLADKSLIRQTELAHGEPRFLMLETIREYAREHLGASEEEGEVSERHAEHFLALAEEAGPQLMGPQAVSWLDRLVHEHDNLRAALARTIDHGDAVKAFRMVGALWRFWQQRAHFREGRDWVRRAFDVPGAEARTVARVQGLTGAGGLAYWQGDYEAAEEAYRERVGICEELGERQKLLDALTDLSYMPALRGDMAGSLELLERARDLARELGDRARLAEATGGAAYFHLMQGDYAKARPLAEEADALWEEVGNPFQSAMSGHTLGQLNRLEGRYQDAWPHLRKALSTLHELGDQASMTESMLMMSALASAEGRRERAVRLLGAAKTIRERLGGGTPPEWLMMGDPVDAARKAIGAGPVDRALTEGRAMSPDQAADYALTQDEPQPTPSGVVPDRGEIDPSAE